MADYTLGRLYAPDGRDQNYPMRALLAAVAVPGSRTWYTRSILDQSIRPWCVAYAWAGWQIASPTRTIHYSPPDWLYNEAQKVDEWPGEGYDGTSVRAGVKVLQAAGKVSEYRWAVTVEDIRQWLLTRGTVVLGTDWHRSMFEPGADGFVHPDGNIAGGHAYLCIGWSERRKAFRCLNSWGTGFGQHGRFWLGSVDLAILLHENGEACAAVEAA